MAVALEFIDFIVPIAVIRAKYPGGWEQCLIDHERLIGGRVWYDEHLLRDGAMNPNDIKSLIDEWSKLGFQPMEERDGNADGKMFVSSSRCSADRHCHANGWPSVRMVVRHT